MTPSAFFGGARVVLLGAALLCGACGGDDAAGVPDAAGGDGGGGMDSGPRDGGRADAGSPRDGGRAGRDSGVPDAAAVDGGPTVAACFEGEYASTPPVSIDYESLVPMPIVGSHCLGTNHQDIRDVERVVFLGDSVTVGTPPTLADDYYRSLLADMVATRFGLTAPDLVWKRVNAIAGTSLTRESGDFASCAEWGARADDLLRDGTQIVDCLPVSERDKRTLVVMTIGGNDLSSLTQDASDGAPAADLWATTMEFVGLLEAAVQWFKEPGRFPNGVYVIIASMFEFTDGTGDVAACPAASLAGFTTEVDDPDLLADLVIWATEQYMRIAVENGIDMIFLLEHFCGHGFNHDDTAAPCYRGPGTEQWFDLSCIHPNPRGHREIADMFMAVVSE